MTCNLAVVRLAIWGALVLGTVAACRDKKLIDDAPPTKLGVASAVETISSSSASSPLMTPAQLNRVEIHARDGRQSVPVIESSVERNLFDREMDWSPKDQRFGVPTSIWARKGVKLRSEQVFSRYPTVFRLRPGVDELHSVTEPVPFTGGSERVRYDQFYKGVRVQGGGYRVSQLKGIFQWADGGLLPGIEISTQPAVMEERVVEDLVRQYRTPDPASLHPELVLLHPTSARDTAGLRLAWHVKFPPDPERRKGAIPRLDWPSYVDVDALTGKVIFAQPTFKR